jgi:UDP-N-acetylglucosamine 2-epimerase (non-hydrolysing)/GDP/UDP-N,N'-diacetylbacillosamine 2-epimerase (hydrolysing)
MGEAAHRILVSGNPALDKFAERKRNLNDSVASLPPLGKDFSSYALLIYHPLDKQSEPPGEAFENILQALQSRGIAAAVGFPNSDPGHQEIIQIIERYSDQTNFWFYKNLPRDEFMRLYHGAQFLIGNSSSGILEAASIPLAAINVGLRQRDRYCGGNVIFCSTHIFDIATAIDTVEAPQFRAKVTKMTNPYGDGASALKIFEFIRGHDFQALIKKIEDPLKMVLQ